MTQITADILSSSTGASNQLAQQYLPYFNAVLDKYEINTQARILAWLSQIGLESGGLKWTEEFSSGAQYEGRANLGNTQPGDGVRFKGRSFGQITGRGNYQRLSNATGIDFVNNPEWLAQPQYAVEPSAWFWQNGGFNELADQMDVSLPLTDPANDTVFKAITKKYNGGYNGLNQRQANWMNGQSFIQDLQQVGEFIKANPKTSIALGIGFLLLTGFTIAYFTVYRKQIKADFVTT